MNEREKQNLKDIWAKAQKEIRIGKQSAGIKEAIEIANREAQIESWVISVLRQ
jgi:hypothetical protein